MQMQRADLITGQSDARQDANHRHRRHRDKDPQKTEQGAARQQRKDHPDRMQAYRPADQSGVRKLPSRTWPTR